MADPPSNRPWVIANFALSADGKVTTIGRLPSLFTSPVDKQRLLAIRSRGDAVMAARGTVEADTMSMTIPDAALVAERVARGQGPQPVRVVVSGSGQLSPQLKVFQQPGGPVVLLTTQAISELARQELAPWAFVHAISPSPLNLGIALALLRAEYQVATLVCEGGPTLMHALFAGDWVDEIYLTLTPWLFGGRETPTLTGSPADFFSEARRFTLLSVEQIGEECFTRYQRDR